MRRFLLNLKHVSLALAFALLAPINPGQAQSPQPSALAAFLDGRWTPDADGACARVFRFRLTGATLRVTAPDGKVDVQRVLQRRGGGVATETTASVHGIPIGTKWVYEALAPGQLGVTDGTGQSATFQHCHYPIPATATPAEFLRGMFDLYVADADAGLPFASDAGRRAFLTPDLADQVSRDAARTQQGGRTEGACLTVDPIVGSSVDYKVTAVDVAIAKPHPDMPDRAGGTVSFRNFGEPRRVAFDLRRTPVGWRIDDLHVGSDPSLRQQMTPCAAGGR